MPFMVKYRRKHQDYISAHEAGQHAYCPEALRLSLIDTPADKDHARRLDAGRKLHEDWVHTATKRHIIWLILALILLAIALLQIAGAP